MDGEKTWGDVLRDKRHMPMGRAAYKQPDGRVVPADPKAPARGFRNNDRRCWLAYADCAKPAAVNFGVAEMDLAGIDLDLKPERMPDAATEERCRAVLNGLVKRFRLCPRERSQGGQGVHIFGAPDLALAEYLTTLGKATLDIVLALSPAGRPAAQVEIFGGGNASITLTENWLKSFDADAPLPVIALSELQDALSEYWPRAVVVRSAPPTPRAERERPSDYERALAISKVAPVPADYHDWSDVASAFSNAGMSDDEIDDWSSRGANYKSGEIHRKRGRWKRQGFSMGWLVRWAQANGVPEDVIFPWRRESGGMAGYAPPWSTDGGSVQYMVNRTPVMPKLVLPDDTAAQVEAAERSGDTDAADKLIADLGLAAGFEVSPAEAAPAVAPPDDKPPPRPVTDAGKALAAMFGAKPAPVAAVVAPVVADNAPVRAYKPVPGYWPQSRGKVRVLAGKPPLRDDAGHIINPVGFMVCQCAACLLVNPAGLGTF